MRPLAAVVAVEDDFELGVPVDGVGVFIQVKPGKPAGARHTDGIPRVGRAEVVERDVGLRLVHVVGVYAVFLVDGTHSSQLAGNGIPLAVGQ